jgi:hypothetical protein
MESDARFYRRRANEELAAAQRAITPAARERRMQLAGTFLERLKASEARTLLVECGITDPSVFEWAERRVREHA